MKRTVRCDTFNVNLVAVALRAGTADEQRRLYEGYRRRWGTANTARLWQIAAWHLADVAVTRQSCAQVARMLRVFEAEVTR